MNKTKFSKTRKSVIAALCAVTVTCTGLAAACTPTENPNSTSTPKREDPQLLRNGDFEYFDIPEDAVYLIKGVNNWSRSGDSSGTMSGIIGTSKEAWEQFTDLELKDKLDANNDLSSSDPDYEEKYVNYNGMKSADILYKDSYIATLDDDKVLDSDDILFIHGGVQSYLGIEGDEESGYTYNGQTVYANEISDGQLNFYFDEEFTQPVRYERIANPGTHYDVQEKSDGSLYFVDEKGAEVEVLLGDNDSYYYVDGDENEVYISNVLMLHNFPTDRKYNGIEQHYSSQTITLEANTAAEISLWVKTSDLKFDKGYSLMDDQDRGAYIEVNQTVAGTTIDSFKIKAINTEKILRDNADNTYVTESSSNGWLKYTIYVNACDFATSTIQLNLGLGDSSVSQKVTGYAFFDDVQVKKFIDLNDEGSTYPEHEEEILNGTPSTYCTLISTEDEKVFFADRETRRGNDDRYSTSFYYCVDLASTNINSKQAVSFANSNTTVKLTTEKDGNKLYASATEINAKLTGGIDDNSDSGLLLPKNLKDARRTDNDLIGIFGAGYSFTASDFNSGSKNYSDKLNKALSGEVGIDSLERFVGEDGVSDMLLLLSAYGAAYTATVVNDNAFTLEADSYKIVSFWVKTSDMNGKTAATVRIVDCDDEDAVTSFTLDTTGKTTDVNDSKNIYNDWVQCFFFVHNDTEDSKTFKLEFSFGNTSISGTSVTSYFDGWVAMANLQTLDGVTEEVFGYISEGSTSKILTLTSDSSTENDTPFDTASGTTNVKKGLANPANYNGVNGGSSYVTEQDFRSDYDKQNNRKDAIAGLINRDSLDNAGYADIKDKVLSSFVQGATNWNDVFGEDCYQPLIIVNSLRQYQDKASATEDTYEQYYIKNDEGNYVEAKGTEYDENETYYSLSQAVNYGFVGSSKTVSSDSYQTVSVRVMVSGDAVAYVYLIDANTREVMSFDTPGYTFYYDDEGNVLDKEFDAEWKDSEHRAAIVYTLRNDGLYDGEDGKVYANLNNLTKNFKFAKFEHNTFYNADGKVVSYDKLVEGETYYNEDGSVASHYLCVGAKRIYEYDAETQKYYYMVEGERGIEVNNFDDKYARYTPVAGSVSPEYVVKVENTDGKWKTVNFFIHTGNEAKSYRLELWSGAREESGYENGSVAEGAVAFDYSGYSVTSSNYNTLISEYESKIVDAYKQLLKEKNALDKLTSNDVNIAYFENKLVEEGVLTEADVEAVRAATGNYFAQYYTFTLYDSASYVPFNLEIAEEGETGYDYTITDYSETLAYFKYYNETENSLNTFIDYSTVDQSINIGTINDSDDDDDDDNSLGSDGWLLITSIILVVAMLFALCAMVVRNLVKKYRKNATKKAQAKNNYKKRERYIRKLGLVRTAEAEEDVAEETPAEEEVPAEPAAPAEVEVEPEAETDAPVEEAPAEEGKDE